jgi:predicted  nucleic acid-binding Zn-ribbon protein
MESRTLEELNKDLQTLQAQYNTVMDQLGQVTTMKVKLEGAIDFVRSQIQNTTKKGAEAPTPSAN